MARVDFQRAVQLFTMDEVLELISWRPSETHNGIRRGGCPLHHSRRERSRSFVAGPSWWYCHVCRVGGDAVSLYALGAGLSQSDAVTELCHWFGRPLPRLPRSLRKPRNRERTGRGAAGAAPAPLARESGRSPGQGV